MKLDFLPQHLIERSRVANGQEFSLKTGTARSVIYWMRTAVRCDENPALDVARLISHQLACPLLVYHAISEDYEFASDRHHTFMLEGARDVQKEFADRGFRYVFHLATRSDRAAHLITLAEKAMVVVTEEMPVEPARGFTKALQTRTKTPIVCVDTACVVPMKLVRKAYTRAFQFRSATRNLYAERLERDWPELNVKTKPFDLTDLPFEPMELQAANLSEWVANCDIDHSVGPVVGSVGGSQSGYARWNDFKERKLKQYADHRNNALADGVSRLSPYLRYGMVSPFRVAREAAAVEGAGAEKFLDELLIWRELAYSFCFYREDHDQWSAIPDWAKESLTRRTSDERGQTFSWEELARGQTDSEFWNAAQKSLLVHGELHNNLRMTWGKAILNWRPCPREALRFLIDLNNRYALDGRDPASYGGILWCLGQFDRPFKPEQEIIGSVRPRPITEQASRFDPEELLANVNKSRLDRVPRIAVIGAGISGLFAARTLQDHGLSVIVFEKSRGVGGRMATRRIDRGNGQLSQLSFDHGAQYFTARDAHFIRYVESWIEQGIVVRWPDAESGTDQRIVVLRDGEIQSESKSEIRYIGHPKMSSLCKHLSKGIEIRTGVRVRHVNLQNRCVELVDDEDRSLGAFDGVIVSAPAAQAAELLTHFPALFESLSNVEMNPCWAVMAAFEQPLTDQWAGAFLHGSFLSWTARNSSKRGRNRAVEQLVIHALPDWTFKHWEHDPNDVSDLMMQEFWRVTGIKQQRPIHLQSHRWKHAIPASAAELRCLSDSEALVVACGDWANGSRVEGAFMSGMAAAGRILRSPIGV